MKDLCSRKAVLHDVANLAYVVGDVREGEYTAHSLHQTFDICAPGNIDRVNRVLDLTIAEVEALLTPSHCPSAHQPTCCKQSIFSQKNTFGKKDGFGKENAFGKKDGFGKENEHKAFEKLVRNLTHEYLVARVFYDWLTVAFPPALSANAGRQSTTAARLSSTAGSNTSGRTSSKTAADNVIAIWKEKVAEARTALESALRTTQRTALTRRVPPI